MARVGLKGVFYKDGPSFEELLLQLRYAARHTESHAMAIADTESHAMAVGDGMQSCPPSLACRWAASHVAATFLPAGDAQTRMWDLTGFPEWVCHDKVGSLMALDGP